MTATTGDSATIRETAEVAVVPAPLSGNPALLGLPSFIVGSLALGMVLVGVVVNAVSSQELYLVAWLVIIVLLTLATLRLPLAFTVLFGLIDVALLLVLLGTTQASSGLLKAGGWVVFAFAAVGVYLFYDATVQATGGPALPLGKPIIHG